MMTRTHESVDDILGEVWDSRDLIELIDELQGQVDDFDDETNPDEAESVRDELARALKLQEEAETAEDYTYGAGFIRDDYFEEYARQFAEDIGAIETDAGWPGSYIDWPAAAAALQQDYTPIEFEGTTWWVR